MMNNFFLPIKLQIFCGIRLSPWRYTDKISIRSGMNQFCNKFLHNFVILADMHISDKINDMLNQQV
jgi:hypothetical protein